MRPALFCLVAAAALASSPALENPKLRYNATLWQHNRFHTPLSKGMTTHVSSDYGVSTTGNNDKVSQQQLATAACQSDAVVVGRVLESAYHLSTSQTEVYGDHLFVLTRVLKAKDPSVKPHSQIIVTRPGGTVPPPVGPITVTISDVPPLDPATDYLLLLKHLPDSDSYRALDTFSTLQSTLSGWKTFQPAFLNWIDAPAVVQASLQSCH